MYSLASHTISYNVLPFYAVLPSRTVLPHTLSCLTHCLTSCTVLPHTLSCFTHSCLLHCNCVMYGLTLVHVFRTLQLASHIVLFYTLSRLTHCLASYTLLHWLPFPLSCSNTVLSHTFFYAVLLHTLSYFLHCFFCL
jgi:hypothetical protein